MLLDKIIILFVFGVVISTGVSFDTFAESTPSSYSSDNSELTFNDVIAYSVAADDEIIVVSVLGDPSLEPYVVYVFDTKNERLLHTFDNFGSPTQEFGYSVALNDDLIVISAPGDPQDQLDSGAVYVYDKNYAEINKIPNPHHPDHPDHPNHSEGFGYSVALNDDDLVVVGVPLFECGLDHSSGLVYVFDAKTGEIHQDIKNPTPEIDDDFGHSVAINSKIIVAGSPKFSNSNYDGGIANVFDLETGNHISTISNPSSSAMFGIFVDIDGNQIIVKSEDGSVHNVEYLLSDMRGGSGFTIINKINHLLGADYVGVSFAVDNNLMVVGTPNHDKDPSYSGIVNVYDNLENESESILTLHNPSPDFLDQFGISVAIDGDTIVVGAPLDDTAGEDFGIVYVYDKLENESEPILTLHKPLHSHEYHFGSSVAVEDDIIIVGASFYDYMNGEHQASYSVYVFDRVTGEHLYTIHKPLHSFENSYFGFNIAIDNNKIIVGDPNNSIYGSMIYVYETIS